MPGPLSTARKRAVERDDVASRHVAAAVLAGNVVAGLATGPLDELRIAQFMHKGPGTAWSGVQGVDNPLVGSGVKPRRVLTAAAATAALARFPTAEAASRASVRLTSRGLDRGSSGASLPRTCRRRGFSGPVSRRRLGAASGLPPPSSSVHRRTLRARLSLRGSLGRARRRASPSARLYLTCRVAGLPGRAPGLLRARARRGPIGGAFRRVRRAEASRARASRARRRRRRPPGLFRGRARRRVAAEDGPSCPDKGRTDPT